MLAILAGLIPSVILPAFKGWIEAKEGTKRDQALAVINERMEARKEGGATIRAGMGHWPFWLAWGLFAWPLGLWWLAVMLDTTFSFAWSVPDLPQSIRPWANSIFDNIFLPGAGVAGATIVAKAIARR